MPDYRRRFRAGGTYFFTVVTYRREKIFSDGRARAYLHQAMAEVRALHPFETLGIVLLPDHCHCIWRMAEGDEDFSKRWGMIKRRFTRLWLGEDVAKEDGAKYRTLQEDGAKHHALSEDGAKYRTLQEDGALGTHHGGRDMPVSASRTGRGERGVWQRRFWEHLIRDQDDFARHMDYIHYNPVKHGYAVCPHEWEHSSFHRWVKERVYRPDWHCQCHGGCEPPDLAAIARSTGE
jgi:putative transposase